MSAGFSQKGNFLFRFNFTNFLYTSWYQNQLKEKATFSFDQDSIGPTNKVFGGHIIYKMLMHELACENSVHTSVVGLSFNCLITRPIDAHQQCFILSGSDQGLYLQSDSRNLCQMEVAHKQTQAYGQFDSFNVNLDVPRIFSFNTESIRNFNSASSEYTLSNVSDCCESLYECICFLDYETWSLCSRKFFDANFVTSRIQGRILKGLSYANSAVFLQIHTEKIENASIVVNVSLASRGTVFFVADVTLVNIDLESRKRIPLIKEPAA